MPDRKVVVQFRIVSRKPGELTFTWRRFPGSQTNGDFPLAWERLLRARHDTPEWEFKLATRQVITVTTVTGWFVHDDDSIQREEADDGEHGT